MERRGRASIAGNVIEERSDEAIQINREILDCFAFGSQ
jgi:hypothetical protein